MKPPICQANPGDAVAIAGLHRKIWPSDSIQSREVERLLAERSHVAHLAVDSSGILGYADGFVTQDAKGNLRWELDLLAVHPDARRRGIGGALLAAQTAFAKTVGVWAVRGLVRHENTAAHRTFRRAGFRQDPAVYHLCTTALDPGVVPELSGKYHLVTVRTFTYRGCWLEGAINPETFRGLRSSAGSDAAEVIGFRIDARHRAERCSRGTAQFNIRGAFQWFHKRVN